MATNRKSSASIMPELKPVIVHDPAMPNWCYIKCGLNRYRFNLDDYDKELAQEEYKEACDVVKRIKSAPKLLRELILARSYLAAFQEIHNDANTSEAMTKIDATIKEAQS